MTLPRTGVELPTLTCFRWPVGYQVSALKGELETDLWPFWSECTTVKYIDFSRRISSPQTVRYSDGSITPWDRFKRNLVSLTAPAYWATGTAAWYWVRPSIVISESNCRGVHMWLLFSKINTDVNFFPPPPPAHTNTTTTTPEVVYCELLCTYSCLCEFHTTIPSPPPPPTPHPQKSSTDSCYVGLRNKVFASGPSPPSLTHTHTHARARTRARTHARTHIHTYLSLNARTHIFQSLRVESQPLTPTPTNNHHHHPPPQLRPRSPALSSTLYTFQSLRVDPQQGPPRV